MTEQTDPTESTDEALAFQAEFKFYPQHGEEEDDRGRVDATAAMRTVAFGIGDPVVLIELDEPDREGFDAKLLLTVGDMDLSDLRDVLHLALKSTEQALAEGN